ncbi:MAG: protein BatD [Ruminococcaceae bacterium]|nr:protein BatD [Oscillospiraceae bacterium]
MATFFNQARLTYSGGTVNSNITAGEIVDVLTVNKTAVVGEYTQGSEITYIINIINSSDTPNENLTLTDNLGAYVFNMMTLQPLDYVEDSVKYFINGILQPAPTVTTEPGLTITPISVPANSVVTIAYTAVANEFAPPEGTIDNTVTVNGNCGDATAAETVSAAEEADLDITKSLSPTTITCGDTLTYTFVIQNSGNADAVATDNIVITDTFTPPFENITVTYNGIVLTSPADYTYDPVTGEFATVAGVITVPAATFTQDPVTGEWTVTPGSSTLTVSGNI